MKKILFLLLMAVVSVSFLSAQEEQGETVVVDEGTLVPDFEQIKHSLSDSTSSLFYPTLVKRFMDGDTTLDLQALQTIYYGQAFLDGYQPYSRYAELDSIDAIDKRGNQISRSELDSVLYYANSLMRRNPGELMAHYYCYVVQQMLCEQFGAVRRYCTRPTKDWICFSTPLSEVATVSASRNPCMLSPHVTSIC